jgi:predicted RNA binding protein YcfA (HicA-like mRNA interferase family)
MTRLPRITGKALVAALGRVGFLVVRTKGSHHFVQHPDGRASVVPVHAGETLGPGLLTRILSDVQVTRDELIDLL